MGSWIERALAVLEGSQDLVPEAVGIGQRLEARSERGILVVAEVAVLHAGGLPVATL